MRIFTTENETRSEIHDFYQRERANRIDFGRCDMLLLNTYVRSMTLDEIRTHKYIATNWWMNVVLCVFAIRRRRRWKEKIVKLEMVSVISMAFYWFIDRHMLLSTAAVDVDVCVSLFSFRFGCDCANPHTNFVVLPISTSTPSYTNRVGSFDGIWILVGTESNCHVFWMFCHKWSSAVHVRTVHYSYNIIHLQ